ncbi:LysR family transcriptional regulator [Sansalvadorimonas sp. 2012CJ34-2]|uniref:LysR family transcriptional regulator n=1 Tax=Parendozoicomonas callyspongiae TaxID=2942213 RepID=A0ABT0PHH7_9GAMM|nr:LysR family transcriptional regulator [Sansalvadorimonas sp. 2012CJ34-2]MCL6270828.1 LysR family transcriptional regulator [Sansalvadorimonas sp. 2012CJ34-2]
MDSKQTMTSNLISSGRLTLRMLRYFYAVAENEHFGHAAEELNISKSPLSTKIKELEDALETTLFIRDSRNVRLTPTGELLKSECRKIFDVMNASVNNVIRAERNQNNTLNIGIVSSAFWTNFLSMVKNFKTNQPDCELKFIEMSPAEQKLALKENRIDIGISRYADTHNISPLSSKKITEEKMCVAVSDEHSLKNRKVVRLDEIRNEQMVAMNKNQSDQTDLVISACLEAGFHPDIYHEVKEPHTALAFVVSNQSITIVPSSFKFHKWSHIRFLALKEYIPAGLYALYDHKSSSAVVHKFIKGIA